MFSLAIEAGKVAREVDSVVKESPGRRGAEWIDVWAKKLFIGNVLGKAVELESVGEGYRLKAVTKGEEKILLQSDLGYSQRGRELRGAPPEDVECCMSVMLLWICYEV